MTRLLGRNLRTRLTVLYAVLLAAALVMYAVCVSAFFLHNLREQMDASLDRDLETVEGTLVLNPSGRLELSTHEGEADEDNEYDREYLLEVWSRDGNLLYRSEQLGDQSLGATPHLSSERRREAAQSLRLPSGTRVRTMSRVHYLVGNMAVIVRLESAKSTSGESSGK